jgi:plasmid stabilization system protein ParE
MNRIVRLREEADRDLALAASWYEQQREGLGHEFLDGALAAFQRIGEEPLTYPVVHRNTRRALMTRFPFGIYFRVEGLSRVLADLPVRAWPYGRVVMATDLGIRAGNGSDEEPIRRNHEAAQEILDDLDVEVDWWPS